MLMWLMEAFRSRGYPAINPSELARIWIPLPPVDEQRAIAIFLDREIAKIDELISVTGWQSQLLYEYRSALLSAAVTGQIDVRGEV